MYATDTIVDLIVLKQTRGEKIASFVKRRKPSVSYEASNLATKKVERVWVRHPWQYGLFTGVDRLLCETKKGLDRHAFSSNKELVDSVVDHLKSREWYVSWVNERHESFWRTALAEKGISISPKLNPWELGYILGHEYR